MAGEASNGIWKARSREIAPLKTNVQASYSHRDNNYPVQLPTLASQPSYFILLQAFLEPAPCSSLLLFHTNASRNNDAVVDLLEIDRIKWDSFIFFMLRVVSSIQMVLFVLNRLNSPIQMYYASWYLFYWYTICGIIFNKQVSTPSLFELQ